MRAPAHRLAAAGLLALASLSATPALATLKSGADAPDFTTPAAQAGNEFSFHLADALKHGPVVLYFYPAAFSSGCTTEAHEFADAAPRFAALHATLIGVSMDTIVKLKRFSTSECHSKFAVASDRDGAVSHAYDAVLVGFLGWSSRTSYVIAPNGRVIYSYNALDPEGHVANTLKALTNWTATHPAAASR